MSRPTGASLYLIDSSVLAHLGRADVAQVVGALVADGVAATCATIDLEVAYAGRDADSVRAIMNTRKHAYVQLDLDERAAKRARNVLRFLADAGAHRGAGIVELLTAAVAELNGAAVLHYHQGFAEIAAVTGQPCVRIAAAGTLERSA